MAPSHSNDHRDQVLRTLKQLGPSTVTELMRAVGPEKKKRRDYRQLLRNLVKDRTLVVGKKGKLEIPAPVVEETDVRPSRSVARSGRRAVNASGRDDISQEHGVDRQRKKDARSQARTEEDVITDDGSGRFDRGARRPPPEPAHSRRAAQERDLPRESGRVRRGGESMGVPGRSVARFEGHREGFGFINPTDGSRDVFIPPHRTGGALHGDLVEFRVVGTHAGGRREGTVVRVASPTGQRVVGLVTRSDSEIEVCPFDARAGSVFRIAPHGHSDIEEGVAVVIEVPRSGGHLVRARLLEVLGPITQPGVDLEVLVRKHHLRVDFPHRVLEESERIPHEVPAEELRRREDFSRGTVVTIDGDTAKDFDDAVGITRTAAGFTLSVHIADVSHYVSPGGAIDIEARMRGTSVYFPGRAIPMLPPALSENICSLKPFVPRLVQSAIMTFDEAGEMTNVRFADGWIRSRARLTYGRVNALLKGAVPEDAETGVMTDIALLNELAGRLAARRAARGGLDFDLPEPEVVLDALGAAAGVKPAVRGPAQRMIEEFMIAANIAVARYLVERSAPALHRVHERPDPLKVGEFAKIAAVFGYEFPRDYEKVQPADFRRFLEAVAGRPEERILGRLLLRTMALARYSPESLGHFGLATPEYLHFTSPIRRYPDLVAHRALRAWRDVSVDDSKDAGSMTRSETSVRGGKKRSKRSSDHEHAGARTSVAMHRRRKESAQAADERMGDLDVLAAECSRLERAAEGAERESLAWKRAEVLMGRVGDEMAGTVSSITPHGIFVELEEVYAEGLLPISALPRDHYEPDATGLVLGGVATGRIFKAGQPIRVLVARVDRITQRVELALVGSTGGGVSNPQPRVRQYGRRVQQGRKGDKRERPKRETRTRRR